MAGEILLIFVVLSAIAAYFIWSYDKKNLRKLNENYNPDDDKSRQGEERRSTGGRQTIPRGTSKFSKVFAEPSRQRVSERADAIKVGEDSVSVGDISSTPHPFRRLQKQ